jgi:hypothetical protein
MSNSFNQFPVNTDLSEAKLIQMNWYCSRTRVSRNSGAAEMASARFVFRAR